MAYLVTNPRHNGPRDRLLRKHSKAVFGKSMSLDDVQALKKSDYSEYKKHAEAAEKIESLSSYKAAGKAFRGALKAGGGKVAAWDKKKAKGGKGKGRKAAPVEAAAVSSAKVKVVGKRVYVEGRRGAMSLDAARAAGYITNGRRNKGRPHTRGHAARSASFRASKGLLAKTNGLLADSLDFVKGELNVRNVVTGVVVGGAHYYVAPMVSEQVAKLPYVGEFASENLSYSITGLAAGAVLVAGGEALNMRRDGIIAAALAFGSGLVLDTVGYLTRGAGGYGDLAVMKNPYGDLAVTTNPYGDLAVTALPEYEGQRGLAGYGGLGMVEAPAYGFDEYGDAEMSDAAACPDDFSAPEGQALIDGPRAMAARFPVARSGGMRRKPEGPYSRHAGQPMARWAWLIKLVGGEKARAIAALPPAERVRVIRALKQQALATANKALSANRADYSAVGAEGAMGAGGAEGAYGYGATVALGAGF
jgi:hypothetical protein